jgi:hypothetical protein
VVRRRGGRDKPIELFPFLAILACIIGVLTLLIAGLSMGALEIDMSGTEFARLEQATAADLAEVEKLESAQQGSRILAARIRHARTELERRAATSAELEKLETERQALQARWERAKAKRDELQEAIRLLEDRVAKLQTEIAERGGQGGPGRPVKLRGPKPRPGRGRFTPRFVECKPGMVVLDADRPTESRRVLPVGGLPESEVWAGFLAGVERSGGIVVLLVREGSVDTYDLASALCRVARVRCGKLAIPGPGAIDFSGLGGAR